MLDERKLIESNIEREKKEIIFFQEKLGLNPNEINRLLSFSKEIKETVESLGEEKETIKKLCNLFSDFFRENQGKKEIHLLLPILPEKILVKPIRKSAIETIFNYLNEDRKFDIEITLDEIISNIYSHSLPESNYALLSFSGDNEKVNKITTLNFSDKELPPHILNLLSGQENKKETLNAYLNFDEERINNFCQENEYNKEKFSEEEICHQRGFEILLNLVKNIKWEESYNEELGQAYKFVFEL